MKTFFVLFALLTFVLVIYPFFDQDEEKKTVSGLPWQIEILPDGSTSVFGLHIASSRLSDAYDILGNDMELAIVAASDEVGSLEMYLVITGRAFFLASWCCRPVALSRT